MKGVSPLPHVVLPGVPLVDLGLLLPESGDPKSTVDMALLPLSGWSLLPGGDFLFGDDALTLEGLG